MPAFLAVFYKFKIDILMSPSSANTDISYNNIMKVVNNKKPLRKCIQS